MSRWMCVLVLGAALSGGCGTTVNVEQERTALLARDRQWSETTKDVDKFMSYFAADAVAYPPGEPAVRGADAIRKSITQMMAAPGFALSWTASGSSVSSSGDLGYTAGSYQMGAGDGAERGKYVTVWKRQGGTGDWMVAEDIFNADGPPIAQHAMVAPNTIKWGDSPPSLPGGARFAVISGDPTQPAPFVIRAQVPAGYRVPPHWHPTPENLTVLSGTVALGMGETWDDAALSNLATGGYASLPADMRHFFLARTAATFQVHGTGPFAINYVNAADDPRTKK
jgi:ketosteroid isomerase-like protein